MSQALCSSFNMYFLLTLLKISPEADVSSSFYRWETSLGKLNSLGIQAQVTLFQSQISTLCIVFILLLLPKDTLLLRKHLLIIWTCILLDTENAKSGDPWSSYFCWLEEQRNASTHREGDLWPLSHSRHLTWSFLPLSFHSFLPINQPISIKYLNISQFINMN